MKKSVAEKSAAETAPALGGLPAVALEVKKMGTHLGAEIRGLDLTQPLDDATVEALHTAHVEHQVLVFPGQNLNGSHLMAFGRRFGELTVHPFSTNVSDTPELIVYDNKPENPPLATDVWHTDETFRPEPPMGTMLCSKIVPEIGGDTVFASMTAAYEGLSDRMQHFISGLEAVHDFKPFKSLFGESAEDRAKLRHFEKLHPPATHPVVRTHPISGKPVLFVNPQFTLRIKGMEERESRSLLDTLFHQALIPEYQYRHRWREDVLVFWDNRSAQHYAVHDYYPHRRMMLRVTIKGDRPFGEATADPASLRREKMPAPPKDQRMRVHRQFHDDLASTGLK